MTLVGMTVAEGAKFVAAAYAVILAVFIVYYYLSAHRVTVLRRDVQLLEDEAKRRPAPAPEAGAE